MHPQTKGMSILLPPRSCSLRRGTWDSLPCPGGHRLTSHHSPGAKGGAGPPACILGAPQTPLKEGTPKCKGSPGSCPGRAPGAAGQQETLTAPHSQKCPGQHGETEAQSTSSRAGLQTPRGGLQPASTCPQPCVPSAHVQPVLPWALGTALSPSARCGGWREPVAPCQAGAE